MLMLVEMVARGDGGSGACQIIAKTLREGWADEYDDFHWEAAAIENAECGAAA